jgi:hypothetical protein
MMTFEILTILVLVNIGATIELWRLWRRAARRPDEFVRILSFDTIRTFLTDIADHTRDLDDTKERFQAEQAIDCAMTEVLWRTSQVYWGRGWPEFAEDYGEINLRLGGTATWYIGRRDCADFQELKLQNKQ